MTRATAKMLAWLYANPAEELAAGVATFFPDVPKDILARSLGRYRDAGLWSRETRMIPQGFARLGQSLHSGWIHSPACRAMMNASNRPQ